MKRKNTVNLFTGVVVVGACVLGIYLYVSSHYVYIDLSVIQAPLITLSSPTSDVLKEVFVKDGETVAADQPVALVGDQIVKAKVAGAMVYVNQNIGQFENAEGSQAAIATMIDPAQLRVVGLIDEDKGLSDIKIGDVVKFTVDAFGSKEYAGVVDEISQTSEASVINNIFNQRPTDKFNVYVRFDPAKYPELKSGMSARVWVYKG